MRQQAQKLKKALEEIEHTEEDGDIKIKVNGAQEIIYIEINGERRDDLVKIVNEANKKVQKEAAKKMMEMGGGLSGLLGGMG